jgi:predicted DNA-binding transcriptional regulator YafY
MAGTEQPKLKVLHLLQLLNSESDEERGVTMARILEYLEQQGVPAERKSVYRDILILQKFGYEIEKNKKKPVEYCLMNRDFDLAELKLLVDAVQSAHFISEGKTDKLIRKIESLTSRSRAGALRRQVHYTGRVKTSNDHVYFTTETLHESINQGVRVTFKYIDYDINKSVRQRRSGESYEISPYALVWNEDKYYVVGYYERYGKVCNFRVDRMKSVTSTGVINFPKPADFILEDHIRDTFGMFTGEKVALDIQFANDLVGVAIDRFGKDTSIHPNGPDHVLVHVSVLVSPVFYSWVFQFGGKVKILRPERIAEEYKKMVNDVLKAL